MTRALPCLVALLALVCGSGARAGQVHYESVALDEVLAATEVVVVVQLDTPASVATQIPVPSTEKDCGTYDYGVLTGTVRDVVHPAVGAPLRTGERLVVFYANTDDLLDLTARACETGGSRSPIFQTYDGAQPKDGATLTALLRWSPGLGWTEAIAGSWLAQPPSPAVLKKARRAEKAFDATTRASDRALCLVDADCVRATLACNACPPCAGHGTPMARAAVTRYLVDCHESLGRPPSPCGPCAPPPLDTPRVVCRQMRCVDDVAAPKKGATKPVTR